VSTVAARRAQLDSQVAEPDTSGDKAQRRAEMDRYLDDHQAQHEWLDEQHRLWLGDDRSAAIYMTHELVWEWRNATADRWYRALPERYMTPDSMAYPDWDHSHYEHDENGHIGRVTTRQRTLTAEDIAQRDMVRAILADLEKEEV
jgi:hypothetical protein